MTNAFLLMILALAVITWMTRALPFLILNRSKKKINFSQGRLQIIGPALLLSTTVVVLSGEIQELVGSSSFIPYLLSVVVVALISKWKKNIGLSVLVGLLFYGVVLLVV
ncbi:MAG: AzlD domain-containing protein [Alcaligenaceae bacterium]|nr:AzlD domain-containing protein [Alcaligenaceae bacterium]